MRQAISEFLVYHALDTDIFCFQEASEDMEVLCQDILTGYNKVTAYKFVAEDNDFPQATYTKKDVHVIASGTILTEDKNSGLGLYVQCQTPEYDLYVCNFHGSSLPGDKLDNPDRVRASQAVINFFQDKADPVIIGGDFNLLPESESVRLFARNNYKDLIKDYNVKTTRNRLAWELYPGHEQYHSDYVFVGKDIKIKDFTVRAGEISDHLPLILEI